ncbi:MAG: ABC transporter permease, partial [Acidobacteria bacterium]|nr:ABC transporter permease [Acidobacteriota bacterium]
MSLRRTWAVARKELLHIVRDPRSLGLALAVPLLMLLLFGYGLTLDVDRVPTLIYDLDRSPESRALAALFEGSRFFHVLGAARDYGDIQRAIDRDRCLVAVVIPRDYSANLRQDRTAEVQVLLDGSDSNTAAIALGYAEAVLRGHSAALRARALDRKGGLQFKVPVEPRLRVWYNSELKSRNYIVPGLIAVILQIIAALLTSLTIAREWETGTMEQLLSTPLRPAELVLGKLTAFFGLGLADTLIGILTGVLIFRVPLRGDPLLLLVTSCVFMCGALGWGVLVSALARSQLLAYQAGMISSFLPAMLLSGFIFAIENMPPVIQAVTRIVPARYVVTMMKGIFLKGVGLEVLAVELAFL